MDSAGLDELMTNFDVDAYLSLHDSPLNMQLRSGMKSHSDDPMTLRKIVDDELDSIFFRARRDFVTPVVEQSKERSPNKKPGNKVKVVKIRFPQHAVKEVFILLSSCSFAEETSFLPTETIPDTPYQPNTPSTAEMVGSYNFHVELGNQSKRVANPEWVYKNNKLYIKAGTLCPIIFSASSSIPQPCNIRIMPVFKNPEDVRDIVRCCPNHTTDNVDKTSFSSIKHFVRCENEQVSYKECPLTGRFYLAVPFIPTQRDPHSKTVSTHELLSFVCNNSCVGLNRRPIQVIFEITHGQVIMGRGLLEVRVCACPGRDSNLDDKQQKQPFRRKRRLPDETTVDRLYMHVEEPPFLTSANIPTSAAESSDVPPKKKKTTGENFYLKINGRQNYVIMERIAKALELFTSMEKRFFSKSFPFQVLEQIQRRSQNECPDYQEADSTVYRRNPCQENMTFGTASPVRDHWVDSTQPHPMQNQAATTSQNMQISYSNHTVRHTSLVT